MERKNPGVKKIKTEFIVIGAGLAGLTVTSELLSKGRNVLCIEGCDEVGGLARNVVFRDHIFDIGGHRFFTEDETLRLWLKQLVGDELIRVRRRSRIYLNGRLIDYPISTLNAFLGMGVGKSFHVLAGYLQARLTRTGSQENFEKWVTARFGRALYDLYFGPYTQKVWGRDPKEISAEWAQQRIQLISLTQAVIKSVFRFGAVPKTFASHFDYPKKGIGRIAAALQSKIEARGPNLITGQPVRQIRQGKDGSFEVETAVGRVFESRKIISTIPLPKLAEALGEKIPEGALKYRSLRCVFLIVNRPKVTDDTWMYFSGPETIFSRLHEPKNWSADMAPGDGTSLCLEIFCDEGDDIWSMPSSELHEKCVADLRRLGLIEESDVEARLIYASATHIPCTWWVTRRNCGIFTTPSRVIRDCRCWAAREDSDTTIWIRSSTRPLYLLEEYK